MCVATVGLIESIDGRIASVNIKNNILRVDIGIVDAKVGDYVLVHAGCAIEVVNRELADEIDSLYDEIEAAFNA